MRYAAWHNDYLRYLRGGATKDEAAALAGVSHSAPLHAAARHPEFAEMVEQAIADATGRLSMAAYETALAGNPRLLMWLLERRNPAAYGPPKPDTMDLSNDDLLEQIAPDL